jgi:hypothetical protein
MQSKLPLLSISKLFAQKKYMEDNLLELSRAHIVVDKIYTNKVLSLLQPKTSK